MGGAARATACCVLLLLLSIATDAASAALSVAGQASARLPPAMPGVLRHEPAAGNPVADTPFSPPGPELPPLPESALPGDLACFPDRP